MKVVFHCLKCDYTKNHDIPPQEYQELLSGEIEHVHRCPHGTWHSEKSEVMAV